MIIALYQSLAKDTRSIACNPSIDISLPSLSFKRTRHNERETSYPGLMYFISRTTASEDAWQHIAVEGKLNNGRGWFRLLFDEEERKRMAGWNDISSEFSLSHHLKLR